MFKLPNKPFHVVQQFLAEHRPLVFKYLIKKIRYAINHNIEKIELFEFTGSEQRHMAVVREPDFEKVLLDAIDAYVKEEDYEMAAKAQEVLQLYRDKQINNLLNEINKED